ncbi:MAG: DEAD/DEAH box helicase [Deltaproteobacteria bacterium]|nr:DEAD/DEAH box helicase [Deltaproteobacteria bacterium]
MSFQTLNLDPLLLKALEAAGFTEPTAVQKEAIPAALSGRDVMASAQTGTGKTAAFLLPAMHNLLNHPARTHHIRVLVLSPTRELAMQIHQAINLLGRFTRLVSGTVVGGTGYGPQDKLLRQGPDILVATPGRLMDHMNRRTVDLSRVELLVLDEADRMLDMGFVKPVETIAAQTPAGRQTLLFSATLEGEVDRVARRLMKDPLRVKLAHASQRHESITQHIHMADSPDHKKALLTHLLADPHMSQAVIFTATKRGADRLAKKLTEDGHLAAPLHGNMSQGARNRTVEHLRKGKVRLLVATDVAARGIDIKGMSHVINFDLPMTAEDYVHRIGRTGRAGATGIAVSLVGPDDHGKLAGIERLIKQPLDRRVVEGLEPSPNAHLVRRQNTGRPGAPARRSQGHLRQPSRHGADLGGSHSENHGSRPARNGNRAGFGQGNSFGPGQGNSRGNGSGNRAEARTETRGGPDRGPRPGGRTPGNGPRGPSRGPARGPRRQSRAGY